MSHRTHVAATSVSLVLMTLLGVTSSPAVALAQQHDAAEAVPGHAARPCTNAMAAGTFGYRMNGVIVGVGPFLVNGIFTHKPDGTMDADVQLVIGNQSVPVLGRGTFKTNPDCTGSGEFDAAPLPRVTYEFILTDGGDQIELLNTNPGIVLHGISRRISKAGREPRCRASQIVGTYGYRLEGSEPAVPNVAAAGLVTHSIDGPHADGGVLAGHDTLNLSGVYLPRTFDGEFNVEPNCRGGAKYTDSLGATVKVVFTVVNDGDTLFLQVNEPGIAIHGVAQRIR